MRIMRRRSCSKGDEKKREEEEDEEKEEEEDEDEEDEEEEEVEVEEEERRRWRRQTYMHADRQTCVRASQDCGNRANNTDKFEASHFRLLITISAESARLGTVT